MRVGVPKEIDGRRAPRRARPGDARAARRGRRRDRRAGRRRRGGLRRRCLHARPARRSATRGAPTSSRRSQRRPPTRRSASASGQALIAFLQPLTDREGIERSPRQACTRFALESIPRITRAQPMDALSSQATVAGYKAALIAADRLPRFFPMLMTAAGHDPAREGARARRGRRGPAGDRDGAAARRRRLGVRRAPGGARAGRVARRDVPRPRRAAARRPRAATRAS